MPNQACAKIDQIVVTIHRFLVNHRHRTIEPFITKHWNFVELFKFHLELVYTYLFSQSIDSRTILAKYLCQR